MKLWEEAETEEEAKRLAGPGGLYWKAEDMRNAAKWAFFICLRIALIALAVIIHYDPVFAQDKAPHLSTDARLAIREAQLKQKQLEAEFLSKQQEITSLQQQMAKLQTQYTEGAKAFQDAIDAAYKEAKIEKKDWNLDMEKLEFTKIAPPAAPPKAEPPKAKP